MNISGLSFVTHHEVDALLGGGAAGSRQRRRLVERGWLPEAPMLGADRDRLAVYPEFSLSALVISATASSGLRRPVERAAECAGALYTSKAYQLFGAALVAALAEAGSRDVVALGECLAANDRSALLSWRDEVAGCAATLASVSVEIEAVSARVVSVVDRYMVDIDGLTEPHPHDDAPQVLALGDLVTRDRVRVASAVRDFLLPVPDLASMGLLADQYLQHDDEDALARALFDGLQGQVRIVPDLGPAREAVFRDTPAVEVPWHLLSGANSMARKSIPA